jgi:hypothetical protein
MLRSSDRYDYPSTIRTHRIVWRHRHKSHQREQNTIALHGLLRELVAESDKRPAYGRSIAGELPATHQERMKNSILYMQKF